MKPVPDRRGQRFGRLLVLYREGVDDSGRALWVCRCDCGLYRVIENRNVPKARSCGCRIRNGKTIRRHGMWKSPEFKAWTSMRERCLNPKHPRYADYGGRGITIDEAWDDFATFFADMGPRPSPGHSLDRFPDNNGNYEPSNCRWASSKDQANNRRNRTKGRRL